LKNNKKFGNNMAIYKEKTDFGDAYGITIEHDGKTLRLMRVIDGGDPLGENLLGTPYLNCNLNIVDNVEKEYADFENTDNKQCFFWEVEGDREQSQKNFKAACEHYHKIYGHRKGILDEKGILKNNKENKYFYAAVIDGYQYSEVSTIRYKNFVDFAIHCMEDCIDDELKKYFKDEDTYFTDYQSFFDDYYGYTSYYFALDENGNELDDEEDNDLTFQNYCKKLNLI
jgi:hypothetical protein